MVICFPGCGRRASDVGDCPKSPNGIFVHPRETRGAPTAVGRANTAAHPGRRKAAFATPGPAVKASGQARARGLVPTRRVLVADVAGLSATIPDLAVDETLAPAGTATSRACVSTSTSSSPCARTGTPGHARSRISDVIVRIIQWKPENHLQVWLISAPFVASGALIVGLVAALIHGGFAVDTFLFSLPPAGRSSCKERVRAIGSSGAGMRRPIRSRSREEAPATTTRPSADCGP